MLSPGTRIGPYEVASSVGAGGMGEVYRARDTKLQRDVALKILPEAFALDAERLARFEREARTLAALNHPQIAQIYGFEQSGTTHALVMELVDGEDLAQRIARGPVPLDDALTLARQIADALEAAHEQGIIHRDLKPANIKVREDGTVKVLDFGLAKALDQGLNAPRPQSLENSPTITSPAMTQVGMILGTAAYMSPEQAKGKPADKRSDIWALGCVLYEMLTGKRAFDGEDVSDTLANVLKSDPDWRALPSSTPAYVHRLLRRSLARDPRRRLAHAADVRLELESPIEDPAATASSNEPPQRRGVPGVMPWVVATLAVAAAAIALAYSRTPDTPALAVRFSVPPPPGHVVELEMMGGAANLPIALSPDGRRLAMLARNSAGVRSLWIRSLDSLEARQLPGSDNAIAPFWSPDGESLGFFADGKLKRIDLAGGTATVLCSLPSLNSASWGSSGVILISIPGGIGASGELLKVSDSGGTPTPASRLETGEDLHTRPAFLPDGRHYIFRANSGVAVSGRFFVGTIDSFERKLTIDGVAGNTAYANGHLLFMRENTLLAQPFDVAQLRLLGEPVPIADGVQTSQNALVGVFSASATGVLAYRTGSRGTEGSVLTWADRTGRILTTVGEPAGYGDLQLSADGRQALVTVPSENNRRDIWLIDPERGGRTRLTFDSASDTSPTWSADGSFIVFGSNRNGRVDLYTKRVVGSGAEEMLFADEADKAPTSVTADGRHVAYTRGPIASDIFVLPLSGERKPFPLVQTPYVESHGVFSPNGRWIAYQSNISGRREVYLTSFPSGDRKLPVSTAGGMAPRWRADGREIFFLAERTMMAAAIEESGDTLRVGDARKLFDTPFLPGPTSSYAVTPDGQRFLLNAVPPQSASSGEIVVVLNWPAGLRR